MGIDIGFDLYPPLKKEEGKECKRWETFIEHVKTFYKNDENVEETKTSLLFKLGEYPTLMKKGLHFRRFSCKLGSTDKVETYIRKVYALALEYFTDRIYFWSTYGSSEENGSKYSWSEVYAAEKEAKEVEAEGSDTKEKEPTNDPDLDQQLEVEEFGAPEGEEGKEFLMHPLADFDPRFDMDELIDGGDNDQEEEEFVEQYHRRRRFWYPKGR